MWTTLLFSGATAISIGTTLVALWHVRWIRRLPSGKSLAPPPQSSSPAERNIHCSVVIAARDEQARIEQTIRRLWSQTDVEAEFLVVNDRSTDATGEILRKLASEDSRLRVIPVHTLPAGWLGKCHACHVAANQAAGEWILFTDADCWLKPDVLARAIRVAEREAVDHVTLTSGLSSKSPVLQACHLLFLLSIANWFSGANRDRPNSFLGFGAFNLVRASAYRACGGYEALRLTVLDDVKLGLLIRRAGKRTRAFLGADDVQCHWGTNVVDMIRVLEKNYFAALEFRLSLVLAIIGFVTLMFGLVVLGAISHTVAGLAAVLAPFSLILPAAIMARRMGWPWRAAIGAPFVIPVFVCALLNSTFVTLRQGGVRWRDTFYSLQALRSGGVR